VHSADQAKIDELERAQVALAAARTEIEAQNHALRAQLNRAGGAGVTSEEAAAYEETIERLSATVDEYRAKLETRASDTQKLAGLAELESRAKILAAESQECKAKHAETLALVDDLQAEVQMLKEHHRRIKALYRVPDFHDTFADHTKKCKDGKAKHRKS
jgi:NCAIR mutase (PurE)-related protein